MSSSWLRSLYPWPTVWDPTSGFGSPAFARQNTAPFEAVWGWIAQTGLDWNVLEKVFYFVPFTILSAVGPWLLARELLNSSRWAVLSALIFATNSHLLLRGTVHLAIAAAFAVGTLVFWADVRAKTRGSARWAVLTGLLLALQAAFDIRIAVLSIWCLVLKVALEALTARSWSGRLRHLAIFAMSLAVFGGIQLSWAVPLLAYKGGAPLPIGDSPVQAFATLANGFTARDPLWTGGPVTFFRSTALPWPAYLTPLVAFSALTINRLRLEFVWLLLCALVAAFLIKQDQSPAGGVYSWLFAHVPTWNLFREATKLFWIPAIAYAVLIPYVTRYVWLALRARRRRFIALGLSAALLSFPVADALSNAVATASGNLGGATSSTHFPSSFTELQTLLGADSRRSTVAFMGGAALTDTSVHRFPLASPLHPDLELWGSTHPYDSAASDNDALNAFCPGGGVPFCYLQPDLFPYLMRELGVGYVVAPAGGSVGSLPSGTSFQELDARVSRILGAGPTRIGSGPEALAVWRLPVDGSIILSAPLVANVLAPTSDVSAVLPALLALRVPAVFTDNAGQAPPADSITVVPGTGKHYIVPTTGSYMLALLRNSGTPSQITVNGHAIASPRVGPHENDIQLIGPLTLSSGSATIDAGDGEAPLMAWSSSTDALVSARQNEVAIASADTNETANIAATGERWVLMRQTFDTEWLLPGADAQLRADGFLNAFHVPSAATGTRLQLRYGTARAELLGISASLAVIVSVVLVAGFGGLRKRRHRTKPQPDASRFEINMTHGTGLSRWIAGAGLACIALSMGSGVFQLIGSPLLLDSALYYLSAGMVLLLVAIVLRLLASPFGLKRHADPDPDSHEAGSDPGARRHA